MKSWRWNRISALLIFALFVSGGFILSAVATEAQSTTVELTVPQTKIITKGRSSPGAQVVVYVNGLESASGIADAHGMYNIHLNNLDTGVYKVAVEAIDPRGVLSARAERDVAVNLQQTSIVDFFLAPTVEASPTSQSFGNNQIQFSGYTARNAQVRVRIGNDLIVLNTKANNQGFYQATLTTNTLAVGIFNYRVEAQVGSNISEPDTLARQLTITPPVVDDVPAISGSSPVPTSTTPSTAQQPGPPSVPEVSAPVSGSRIDGSSAVINGTATPGSEVLIYEEDELIGVVLASQTGDWQFYFQATRETHRLRIQECFEGNCGNLSAEIELHFGLIREECALDLRLSQYRLTANLERKIKISSVNPIVGTDLLVFVNWGDSSEQRFNIDSGDLLTAEYAYSQTGIYNGYVIVTDDNNCTDTAYFTVRVSDVAPSLTVVFVGLSLTLVGAVVFSLIILYRRFI